MKSTKLHTFDHFVSIYRHYSASLIRICAMWFIYHNCFSLLLRQSLLFFFSSSPSSLAPSFHLDCQNWYQHMNKKLMTALIWCRWIKISPQLVDNILLIRGGIFFFDVSFFFCWFPFLFLINRSNCVSSSMAILPLELHTHT